MHNRHRANEITEYLLLHHSTVFGLSYFWYCIGLLFFELLIGLPLYTWICIAEKGNMCGIDIFSKGHTVLLGKEKLSL